MRLISAFLLMILLQTVTTAFSSTNVVVVTESGETPLEAAKLGRRDQRCLDRQVAELKSAGLIGRENIRIRMLSSEAPSFAVSSMEVTVSIGSPKHCYVHPAQRMKRIVAEAHERQRKSDTRAEQILKRAAADAKREERDERSATRNKFRKKGPEWAPSITDGNGAPARAQGIGAGSAN